jgi:hypothetical protein
MMVETVSVAKLIDKIVRCFLAVGFFVPCLLELLWYLGMPIEWMGEWLLFTLWPAFGLVMASDTGSGYGDSDNQECGWKDGDRGGPARTEGIHRKEEKTEREKHT